MSYVSIKCGRFAAFIGLLGLGLTAAFGQLLPPNDYFEWSGGGGDGLWQTGTNWIGGPGGNGDEPTINADVLFANAPPANNPDGNPYQEPIIVKSNASDPRVNSLWFETGRDYTIEGGSLRLGGAAQDGDRIIVGLNTAPAQWQSEHNINSDITFGMGRPEWTAQIASYSAGGMRIGGDFSFASGSLKQTGGGAMHFAGRLIGDGENNSHNLTIATAAGHMILSGNNSGWRGALTVNHGFLVATANNALGSPNRAINVHPTDVGGGLLSGSTLAFRPKFVGPGLNNSSGVNYTTAQSVTVSGRGYLRPWGAADPYDPYSPLNLRPVGAIYNDGGNNTFAGDITVVGETWFGSRHGVLTLTGRLLGEDLSWGKSLDFIKVGRGVIALANGNPGWDEGYIMIRDGVLRLSHTGALNQAKTLVLFHNTGSYGGYTTDGGILELGAGNFSGTLGVNESGEIGWNGVNDSGGFSAYGANRTVTLNDGEELIWGSGSNGSWSTGGFVQAGALLLNSDYGTHQISFVNPIKFNAASREIRVARGAMITARGLLSGKLSGTGGILKTGLGTLWLNNATNNYTGATVIREGTLGGRVPSGSRIDFGGGVLGINANFARNLGTASNRIRWRANRDGGFAAYGNTDRTVTLGAAGSTVTFGATNFVSANNALIFGAYDANGTVRFNNRLGLSQNATRRIRVIRGTNDTRADVLFQQQFYGPGPEGAVPIGTPNRSYNLLFEGDGRADINQAHAAADWESMLVRTRGVELRLNGAGTLKGLTGTWMAAIDGDWIYAPATLRAEWGGSVTLDNQGSHNSLTSGGLSVADRLDNRITIALNAGTFRLWGGNANVVEIAGELRLEGGANTLQVRSHLRNFRNPSYLARLHLSKLVHNGLELPTINFTGVGLPNAQGNGAVLTFGEVPEHTYGILPYATVNGTNWARTQTQNGLNYLTAYSGYQTAGQATWTSETANASPVNNQVLSANRSLNSLRLTSGRTVNLLSWTLDLISGGLLATGTGGTKILGGTLQTGTKPFLHPLYAHIYNTGAVGLEISSSIQAGGIVKTGPGLMLLSGGGNVGIVGPGEFTTRIHEGTLALGKTTKNYLGGTIIVGDRSGTDILRLDRAEQIANSANVTLRGGHPDPSRFLMAEGILQFNGIDGSGVGIRETINNLRIEGRGVIDFRGGEVGRANFLIIEGTITFDQGSRLFIRNWYEFEDYILIRRSGAGLVNLSNIEFEGYGPAIFRPWDGDYYQITSNPEPATYGAILGAVGVGLWTWRRRRRQASKTL